MWSVVFYVISFWWVHVCVRNSNFSPRVKMGFEAIYCFFALFIFFCFRDITILNDTHAYFEWFDDLSHSAEHMSHGLWHVNALDRFEPGFQIYANMIMHFRFNCHNCQYLIYTQVYEWHMSGCISDVMCRRFRE